MKRLSALFLLFFLFFAQIVFAQWDDGRFDSSAYGSVSQLKAEISSLIQLNDQLKNQNMLLKQERLRLLEQVKRHRVDIEQARARAQAETGFDLERLDELANAHGAFADRGEMRRQQNAEVQQLRTELIDSTENERLWKLQIADLTYQKRDLELEIKQREYEYEIAKQDQESAFSDYRDQLEAVRDREEQLSREIEEMEIISISAPTKVEKLENEIMQLEEGLGEISSKKTLKDKEVAYLKNKKEYLEKSLDLKLKPLRSRKQQLQVIVEDLEKRYQEINFKASTSLNLQRSKRKLLRSVMNLDKENQFLRGQIEELQSKIASHTPAL